MAWVKLDDGYYDHPKLAAAGPLAELLWIRGLAWCNRNESDGYIPVTAVTRLLLDCSHFRASKNTPKALVDAGLWDAVAGGWRYHDYHDFQPSRETLDLRRADAARRQQEWRDRRKQAKNPNLKAVQ